MTGHVRLRPLMVGLLVLLFRWFLNRELLEDAKAQADRGIAGRMEGHAEMDMSVTDGTLWQRITSERGLTAISHYFVMDCASVWLDIAGGLLIAGALAAWVPPDFWQSFFLVDHPLVAKFWGPIVGPLVAVVSFVCSILNIYRKYYGLKMAGFLFVTFYAAMAGAAFVVELIFGALGLVPGQRNASVVEASVTWNYTTWLNIAFLILAALLVWRFLKTDGLAMLRMMNRPAASGHLH